MSFLLVNGGKNRVVFTCSRGVPAIVQTFSGRNGGRLNYFHYNKNSSIPHGVALFRTSAAGREFGPYESPQMRQSSSTSLDVPALGEVISKENAAESSAVQKQKEAQKIARLEKTLTRSLTVLTKTYDFVTLPIYAAFQQPWKKLALHNSVKAITVDPERQIYTSVTPKSELHQEIDSNGIQTLAQIYTRSVEKNGSKNALGVRDVNSEEEVLDHVTGKYVKKFELGDYKWKTYNQVDAIVKNLSRGFEVLQLKPKEKIAIFAETREEWFITAMAAFKKNLPIVTVFTTLADEGVVHALTETEVTTLITSEELMPRCQEILKSVPQIQKLVYMDKPKGSTWNGHSELPKHVNVYTYNQLVNQGAKFTPEVEDVNAGPKPDDVAIIMYTSGSTGVPKGVMLSHKNIVCGLKASTDVTSMVGAVVEDDAYLAYLPLAHAMELACELMSFIQGIPIGYSSPLTLLDKSIGVKEGSVGDATIIRPTVLPAVPLVVERICKGIKEKVAESGPIKELLFNYFYNYKTGWKRLGYETPLVNKIFFGKITSLVGGRIRYLVVGGAPLAPQTQEFISTCLCSPISIGYGMTETGATGAMTFGHDLTFGRAGSPINGSYFKLVDWEDGGYRVTDKPYPRGEIYMGGDNVALGYFKQENSTDFFEEGGTRWIKTGDIAEVHPDGTFVIIDRKKDLVKISTGKFVSLGKVESVLKVSKYVENICVYADSLSDYTVALVVPSQINLEKLGKKLKLQVDNYAELCNNPAIHSAVLEDIQTQGKQLNLNKYDIPKKITLCPEPWVPQSGLVTAAFKIKRGNVYKHYKEDINRMYGNS